MTREVSSPNGADFFEIRFESIGGLGAHVAGKIIASAAVLRMNMNGSHFSSYGSEKKGSVVRSFIRLAPADKAIRTSAPIEEPDVIVVFHSGLLAHPATVSGMKANGILIYAGKEGEVPEGLRTSAEDNKDHPRRRTADRVRREVSRERGADRHAGRSRIAARPAVDSRRTRRDVCRQEPEGRESQRSCLQSRRRRNRDHRRTSGCSTATFQPCNPTRSGATRAHRLAVSCRLRAIRHTTTCTRPARAGCLSSTATNASTAVCATWSAPIFAWSGRPKPAKTASPS